MNVRSLALSWIEVPLLFASCLVAPCVAQNVVPIQSLLQEVEALAAAADPSATEEERIAKLASADALCDEAQAKGADVFVLRAALAKQATAAGAWAVASALYEDCAAAYGEDRLGAVEAIRNAGYTSSLHQQSLPIDQRDFGPALRLLEEVAEIRRQACDVIAAEAKEERVRALELRIDAVREVGVTLMIAGKRGESRQRLEAALDLAVEGLDELQSTSVLRRVNSDLMELLSPIECGESLSRCIRLVQERLPNDKAAVLELEANRMLQLQVAGREQDARRAAEHIAQHLSAEVQLDSTVRVYLLHALGKHCFDREAYDEASKWISEAKELVASLGLTPRELNAHQVMALEIDLLSVKGRLHEAIELLGNVVVRFPGDDWAWQRRGRLRLLAGDFESALADTRQAIALRGRGEFGYQALANEALIVSAMGRTNDARCQMEDLVRAIRMRPPQKAEYGLARALRDLSSICDVLGDYSASLAHVREACGIDNAMLGNDALQTQYSRTAYGGSCFYVGDFLVAEASYRSAIESLERIGALQTEAFGKAAAFLAEVLAHQGKIDEASEWIGRAGPLLVDAPFALANSTAIRGSVHLQQGRLREACAELRPAIEAMDRLRPESFEVSYYRAKLMQALAQLGDVDALHAETATVYSGIRSRLEPMSALSVRERMAVLGGLLTQAEQVLALRLAKPDAMASLDRDLFEGMATLRAFAGPIEASRVRGAKDPARVQSLWRAALQARRRIAALDLLEPEASVKPEELAEAVQARDAADKALVAELPAGSRFAWISMPDVAARLRTHDAVALAVHRVRALPPLLPQDHFLGFALDAKGKLTACDLGPAAAIEALVREWRLAVAPVYRDAGRPVGSQRKPTDVGVELRRLVLDPLLADARCKRVFYCFDDVLNTVPWDVLPQGEKMLGDVHRFASLPSLRDLFDQDRRPVRESSFVALGDIDYDAEGAGPAVPLDVDRPLRLRGSATHSWERLLFSHDEVEGVGALFRDVLGKKPTLLEGAAATKEALFAQAPRASWLHFSTHGGLAESEDAEAASSAGAPAPSTRNTISELSQTWLVLAGANRPVGSRDEVPGLVTAEELAGLDLFGCRLAVLAGCETGVGSRQAGQALASLQSALHAAGTANSIASLWRVPDATTKDLMVDFYRRLWARPAGLAPDEALWQAKVAQRDAKRPLAAWAGWVFCGVPTVGR